MPTLTTPTMTMPYSLSLFFLLLSLPAGYFAADFFVGMYHMLTDKGWNIRRQVLAFHAHHGGAIVFDLKPIYFAMPIIAAGAYWHLSFVVAFAFFAGVSELTHYSAHRPQRCPRFVRWLQRTRLILPPKVHAAHHDGVFDHSFCVFSGWMNWLVDAIARHVPERQMK